MGVNQRSLPFIWPLTSIFLQRYSRESWWATWMSMNYETIPRFCIHDWLHRWFLTEHYISHAIPDPERLSASSGETTEWLWRLTHDIKGGSPCRYLPYFQTDISLNVNGEVLLICGLVRSYLKRRANLSKVSCSKIGVRLWRETGICIHF